MRVSITRNPNTVVSSRYLRRVCTTRYVHPAVQRAQEKTSGVHYGIHIQSEIGTAKQVRYARTAPWEWYLMTEIETTRPPTQSMCFPGRPPLCAPGPLSVAPVFWTWRRTCPDQQCREDLHSRMLVGILFVGTYGAVRMSGRAATLTLTSPTV